MTTPIFEIDELTSNQSQPEVTVNQALRQIETLVTRAISLSTAAEPSTPSEGDAYILPSSPTGSNWGGYSQNDIAYYIGGAWYNLTPIEGVRLWVNDVDAVYAFDGTSWGAITTGGTLALNGLSDVVITSASTGEILKYDGANWVNGTTTGTGTVTSVAMTVPTGLTVSGTPITSSGTLAVTLTAGYVIPTTTSTGQWDTAYGWGDHSTAGYLSNLVEDTTPQLGGPLDANGQLIDMGVNDITDTKVGQWDTAYGWGDHASAGYLTTVTLGTNTDVVITGTPADNEVLAYDTATSKWINQTASEAGLASALNDLTDVTITSVANGHILSYNNTSGEWENGAPASVSEVNDLTAAVTWANVPDANITQSSVTQHQAALSVTSSQVSDFAESVDDRVDTLLQAGNGIDISYDDGANELTISSEVTEITAYNGTGSTLSKGTVVYQSGVQGTDISVAAADNTSSSTMPAVGIVIADITNASTGKIAVAGLVNNLDTSSFTAGNTLYVGTSGALTATKPTGASSLIQNFGKALKINVSSGQILVSGAGRSNDVPNLADGTVFIGNASNVAEQRALVEADISDLGTYLTDVVSDTTPQLGGDLDVNGYAIKTAGTGDLILQAADVLQAKYNNGGNTALYANSVSGKIAIGSATTGSSTITLDGSTTVTGAFTSLGIDDNASSTAVTIDSSQNVGIGDGAITSTLDVHSTTASSEISVEGSGGKWITLLSGTGATGPALCFDDTSTRFRITSGSDKQGGSATEIFTVNTGGVTFEKAIEEQQYSLTGTVIDPSNGTIQYKTLAANTTFTESLSDGEFVTLMIDDGSAYTVTWPTTTWVGGSAPTLETTGYNVIELWQVNGTLYGAFVGAA